MGDFAEAMKAHGLEARYEPLASYLYSRFGDIYADDPRVPWTSALKAAVIEYVLNEVADSDIDAFFEELFYWPPKASRLEQAVFIVDRHKPWEVAHASHDAAVRATPTLRDLIGHQAGAWKSEGNELDTIHWLAANTDCCQLAAMARELGRADLIPSQLPQPHSELEVDVRWDLAEELPSGSTPERLLHAWENAGPPETTDLTDAEWGLLQPLMPDHPRASSPEVSRRAINFLLNRATQPGTPRPRQFGSREAEAICARHFRYKRKGVFACMLKELKGRPGAERLVEWLRWEVRERKTPMPSAAPSNSTSNAPPSTAHSDGQVTPA